MCVVCGDLKLEIAAEYVTGDTAAELAMKLVCGLRIALIQSKAGLLMIDAPCCWYVAVEMRNACLKMSDLSPVSDRPTHIPNTLTFRLTVPKIPSAAFMPPESSVIK